jgi:hypothetical protein
MGKFWSFVYLIVAVCTSMIGYAIHHNLFWSVLDFLFCPIVWAKWLICHQVTLSIIHSAFAFFLK